MKITKKRLEEAKTKGGGYTQCQVDHAQKMFPGKWRKGMKGSNVPQEYWDKFVELAGSLRTKRTNKPKIINSVSKNDHKDWSWKPDDKDIPQVKTLPSLSKKVRKAYGQNTKQRKKKISKQDNSKFYLSRDWLELRVRVFEKYECKCMMCGRSPKYHNVVIHVDHIKPRSKYPELSLVFENMQILCAACNLGKSNKYKTDWRPDSDSELEDEQKEYDLELLNSSPL